MLGLSGTPIDLENLTHGGLSLLEVAEPFIKLSQDGRD